MKRAIVTGGSGLIGQAICAHLLRDGWEVASFDLKEGALGLQIHCDLSSEASVNEAFRKLGWDRLDLLVNNGGLVFDTFMRLDEASLEQWNSTIGSHLTGAFLMSRAAQPLLGNGGSIIMMASTRALMSEGVDFAYAAAKGGMVALAQALAIQLGPKIRVNTIAPGWITDATNLSEKDEAQHPVGRVGRPQDIAEAVLYLVSAGFVTGQTLIVDGGMTKKMIYAE
ncbi:MULTISPECIES: SDR family NAD(P)-dependent oxidoreductase [Hyphomicrobiales]|uniref:SDR family oxidoreductase n=1 Tax=Brucella anthropi TaxID=529 RepID=A0A6I0DIH1_BRUAN|nr:SDR family oxidoreductase [Brucella anthropi]KAB2790765.1 SDR family oxidoreductase [Brucella anthropi]